MNLIDRIRSRAQSLPPGCGNESKRRSREKRDGPLQTSTENPLNRFLSPPSLSKKEHLNASSECRPARPRRLRHPSRRAQPPGAARPGAGGQPEREHGFRHPVARRRSVPSAAERALDRHVSRGTHATFSRGRTTIGPWTSRSPPTFGPPETGDAWLGVFKSFDGGITWKSTLLPGYPQQVPRTGPLSTFTTAADPVVRAGTNGLFYYSGIAFNRGTNAGVLFVSRFMDLNNKENGDPTLIPTRSRTSTRRSSTATGPRRVHRQAVDRRRQAAPPQRRLQPDHPQPQPGNPDATVRRRCLPAPSTRPGPSHRYRGLPDHETSSSRLPGTAGAGGPAGQAQSESNKVNQGASIAIDPATGVVYVVWRRFAGSRQPDAILVSKSTYFAPDLTSTLTVSASRSDSPSFFDQGTSTDSFRTNAYPTSNRPRRRRSRTSTSPNATYRGSSSPGRSEARRTVTPRSSSPSRRTGLTWSTPTPIDNGDP